MRSKRGKGLHAVVESLKLRVACEDSLVGANSKNHLNCLEQNEVGHRKSACEELLVAKEVSDFGQTLDSLVCNNALIILLEGQTHEAGDVVFKDALKLNNSASLSGVCSHEGRAPFVTDVHSHGCRLSELEVAVNNVRQVRVFQTQALLVLF